MPPKKSALILPLRWVHLDFHTSPLIRDVGVDFDADEFARTLSDAHVEVCTCFARCHHGQCYYPSQVGPVHPGLKFDLFGQQLEACHRLGIKVPAYITCVWDDHVGKLYPEWLQVDFHGRPRRPEYFAEHYGGWHSLCLNSPYVEYLEAIAREVAESYEIDGVFYDIVWHYPPGCYCHYCLESMARAGLDPKNEDDVTRMTEAIIDRFMARMSAVIWECRPQATIFYNGIGPAGERLEKRIRHMSHVEIEALPTGGWGYSFFPFWSRYARQFGKPIQGMTGRFQVSWGDFGGLKSPRALKWECGGMLANTAAISIGDQMHPRGRLDAAVYRTIGEAFADVAAKQPYCQGAQAVTEIGLLLSGPKHAGHDGAMQMLLEEQEQFDVIEPWKDFSPYRVLVIPDATDPTPELVENLHAYLESGGALLLSHEALLDREAGEFALSDLLGVSYRGPSPFSPDFFRPLAPVAEGIPADFLQVLTTGGSAVAPAAGAEVLAEVWDPYFNRTWEHYVSHSYTPARQPSDRPGVVRRGNVVYLYGAMFGAYWERGDLNLRRLVRNCLRLLLPEPLIRTSAPATAEVTVTRLGGKTMAHVVNYHALRRTVHAETLDDIPPLHDVEISLRLPAAPRRVFQVPGEQPLEFTYQGGRAQCVAPRIEEHGLVVFEGN
jgi:hypothetical protein